MKLPPAAYSAEVAASATKAGSGSIRQRRIKSLAATAKQSDSPCVRQGDIVWLGAVGAPGCLWKGGPKIRKARNKRNPLLLVPEAGIEPAWDLWARGILRPPRICD
jgi:hypothetical protein